MSEFFKANTEDAPYFITLTTVGWIDIFTRQTYCHELIKNLQFCQQERGLEIYAYVIMSSHIHMIVRRQVRHGLLSNLLRDFKSATAKKLINLINENPEESRKGWLMHLFKYYANVEKQNSELMFWQKTSHPVELFSNKMIDQKLRYIHWNPVKAGIVIEPHQYLFSSACPESPLAVLDAY
ncbi:transposase [Spirosoma sp. HMF4905]|uniref:Transposase n=1 Tax=Spirosoma arboris TaxID=2682092 RepID=A0A7K1SE55_9BACT|nr:transposase [Spirosoma arboris]MVM32080.1 transposase [Spirosoma arboris]